MINEALSSKVSKEASEARRIIAQAKEVGTAAAVYDVIDSLAVLSAGEYNDVAKELKKAIPHLDLRELKGAVTRVRRRSQVVGDDSFPQLMVNDRQLREMGDEAIALLDKANVPPTLFVRSGSLCVVIEDELGRPHIRFVTEDIITARLARVCNFIINTEDGLRNAAPPRNLAAFILSQEQFPFPGLDAITRSPTIRKDGSIAITPGYDAQTRLYYHAAGENEVVVVPDTPDEEQVRGAVGLIEELLYDFRFECPASKANAIALLLSPIVQPAIDDVIPLMLIDAPTAGSGKSLLATVASAICTGSIADLTTAPAKEEEWSKKITAILAASPSVVVIDNVHHTLKSPDLAALLTTRTWKERIFGKNTETISLPNRATWVATGNNIQLGGDIVRRCVWIRIDPKDPKPHERKGFLHENLVQWVLDNRGRLLSALLTICRAWYASGCPEYSVPAFGSFERWSKTVGSILAHAGIEGFLANRDMLWEQSDTETMEWETFLDNWHKIYGSEPINPQTLVRDIERGEEIAKCVPLLLVDIISGKGNRSAKVGYQLKARRGKRYGANGLRLERGPRLKTGITWSVIKGDLTDECIVESKLYTKYTPDLSVEQQSGVECVELKLSHAGAEDNISKTRDIKGSESRYDAKNPTQLYTLHQWSDENIEEF